MKRGTGGSSAVSVASVLEELQLTAEERRRLEVGVTYRGEFVLAGTRFQIGTNDPEAFAGFRARYGALESSPDPGSTVAVEIFCALEHHPVARLSLLANGKLYRFLGAEAVENVAATIFHLMAIAVRTHYLLHAGCVAVGGRGIVIAASTGAGKSTLCAHLAVRGAELLSDEIAPLDRTLGLVAPAPIAVGIRPGAGERLATGRESSESAFRGDRKKLVSVGSLSGREPAGPVRPAVVVFVTPRASVSVVTLAKHRGPVRITLTAWDEGFGAEIAQTAGLRVLMRGIAAGLPFIDCESLSPLPLTTLARLAAVRGIGIVGVRLDGYAAPDFAAEPLLQRLPTAAGVLEVVKRIYPPQLCELLCNEFGGRMVPLVHEIAVLLGDASFYKLTPGHLESMLALLEGLA